MLRIALLLLTAATLAAQTTRVVDHINGPYKTLQSAIDAARPGDLVEVRRGGMYGGATCSKGVQIFGAVRFEIGSDFVFKNVPGGQHAGLADCTMKKFNTAGAPIKIENCKGTVQLHSVEGFGSSAGPALGIKNSAHVSATSCQFTSHGIVVFGRLSDLGGSVELQSSNLTMRRCQAVGKIYTYWNGRAMVSSSFGGVVAYASRVVLVDSSATGGGGYCINGPFGCIPIPGYAGLEGKAKSLLVVKRVTAIGGKNNSSSGSAPGVRADATSRIVKDAATTVTVGGPVTTQDLYDLEAIGNPPGGNVTVTMRGKGIVPFAVFANHPALPVTGPPVDIWLDLRNPLLLYADALNGSRTTPVATPKYLPLGLVVCLQAVVLTTRGLESSIPVVISLR